MSCARHSNEFPPMHDNQDFPHKLRKTIRSTLRRAMPYVSEHLTSTKRIEHKREQFEAHRKKKGEAHVVTYFHDVTDPYSHLAAQLLTHLTRTYEIDLRVMLVNPPADEAAPERGLLAAYSLKDAADIAPYHHHAEFAPGPTTPSAEGFAKAGRLLSAALARSTFVDDAPRIGTALWSGGSIALDEIATELPMADEALNDKHRRAGDKEREHQKHYLGAVFAYGGECYWGIDRLYHLEERLVALGVRNAWAAPKLIAPRRAESTDRIERKPDNIKLELFASMRSPYSYIVMERTFRLVRQYGLEFEFRPILPMVMRSLPVPAIKRNYITLDTKREAEAAGIEFGRMVDPVGEPVERVYSLYPWARDQGLGNDLLLSFAQGAFADGIDGGTDEGLKLIVERAGLNWDEACTHLGNDDWRLEFEGNRVDLITSGLWGAPTFKIIGGAGKEDFITWGQDRLWLVEEEVKKRMARPQTVGQLTA